MNIGETVKVPHVKHLVCSVCGKDYPQEDVEYACPSETCGGNLNVVYDYEAIKNYIEANGLPDKDGMWRYKPFLPVRAEAVEPNLLVGGTPLYDESSHKLDGFEHVYIKDDSRNPTGSLKDRASAVLVCKAQDEKRPIITTASTGNAGAALAGVCAAAGMSNVIFAPASAPPAKICQLVVYGADVILVDGTYDEAFDLCVAASEEFKWYCRNTGYNPYTAEGKKTVSLEICEQLAKLLGKKGSPAFVAPDWILVSVGDGNIITGVYKGLHDLYSCGLIEKMPRLVGVQSEGSDASYRIWKSETDGHEFVPIECTTIADSISAGLPRDRVNAVAAVRKTNGFFVSVTDDEIVEAIPKLSRATGVFAEPAASCAFAGLQKLATATDEHPAVDKEDKIVVLITGSGLKDVATAQKSVGDAAHVAPGDLASVKKVLGL